jgi:hypothetical protein
MCKTALYNLKQQKRMATLKTILRYYFGVSSLICSIYALYLGSIFSSIMLLIMGIMCVPPLFNWVSSRIEFNFLRWHKYTLVIVTYVYLCHN